MCSELIGKYVSGVSFPDYETESMKAEFFLPLVVNTGQAHLDY